MTAQSGGATATYTVTVTRVVQAVDPTVTSPTAAAIQLTSATLGGTVSADGGATVTARGVVYSSTEAVPTLGAGGVSSAAAVAGGAGIRKEATVVAAALDAGQSAPEFTGPALNGIHLAMLTTSDGRALPESDYRDTSDAFDGLAGAFEAASRGDAGFAALVFNIVIVSFCGLLLAAIWLMLLVPLFDLLRDLTGISNPSEWMAAGGLWS